jgi:hypothetical protein
MAKTRSGKLPHLEFLVELHELLARHRYTMAPLFNRIAVYDVEGRTVCSFRQMESDGLVDLRFGRMKRLWAARTKGGTVKQLRLPHVPVMATKALVRDRLEGFALHQRARDERRRRQSSARRCGPAVAEQQTLEWGNHP